MQIKTGKLEKVIFKMSDDIVPLISRCIDIAMGKQCDVVLVNEEETICLHFENENASAHFLTKVTVPDAKSFLASLLKPKQEPKADKEVSRTFTCEQCGHIDISVPKFSDIPDDHLFGLLDEIDRRSKASPSFNKRLMQRQIDQISKHSSTLGGLMQDLHDVFHGEQSRD
jgi:hypothetical protein